MTSLEAHDDEDSLSQSTGSYSIKLSTTAGISLAEDDLNVVKKSATGLEHVSVSCSVNPLSYLLFIAHHE